MNDAHFQHRAPGYVCLEGNGLEIGALNLPANLLPSCRVEYFDVHDKPEICRLFPEFSDTLDPAALVEPAYIGDVDQEGLSQFEEGQYQFVIINHVLEHVANPIKVICDVFRIVQSGGNVVLSVPDKHYTFDKSRCLTPFPHLLEEFQNKVTAVSDDHYLDFLNGVHPEVMAGTEEEIAAALASVRGRREHAHVWESESFKNFLGETLRYLKIGTKCLYESMGVQNNFEYFCVLTKL